MAWITPFAANISAWMTLPSFTFTREQSLPTIPFTSRVAPLIFATVWRVPGASPEVI